MNLKILKEEVRDLLDQSLSDKADSFNLPTGRTISGKLPIQIREMSNGVITLAGITEADVRTKIEMMACLQKGSMNRATGSTNMNNQSRFLLTINLIIFPFIYFVVKYELLCKNV